MMKCIPLVLVALLPMVLFAGVTVESSPANAQTFVSIARVALDDGEFFTAWALYECALRRDPRSPEALAGRLAAWAMMEDSASEQVTIAVR